MLFSQNVEQIVTLLFTFCIHSISSCKYYSSEMQGRGRNANFQQAHRTSFAPPYRNQNRGYQWRGLQPYGSQTQPSGKKEIQYIRNCYSVVKLHCVNEITVLKSAEANPTILCTNCIIAQSFHMLITFWKIPLCRAKTFHALSQLKIFGSFSS